ncbi:MAG: DUF6512 family protein [Candidatus Bathyarchaeia archaeon]|jgi:hypothetical protein
MVITQKTTIRNYELLGIVFITILGSVMHFTFELSGNQPIVGVFSAVNESVWEHLKLGFWPSIIYLLIEYKQIKPKTNNYLLAKTAVPYTITAVIPAIFYTYTAFTKESILMIDILSFIIAVIIAQLVSYKLLTHKQLPAYTQKIAFVALLVLLVAFVVFTFYPPHNPLFQDPISGEYGIINSHH